MICRFIALFFLLLAPTVFAKPPEAAPWQAGAAKVAITPKRFMWMSGYGSRTKPAEGKVHDLWAKALALQTPEGKRCVLITMDLVGIDRALSKAVCAQIEKRNQLPRSRRINHRGTEAQRKSTENTIEVVDFA